MESIAHHKSDEEVKKRLAVLAEQEERLKRASQDSMTQHNEQIKELCDAALAVAKEAEEKLKLYIESNQTIINILKMIANAKTTEHDGEVYCCAAHTKLLAQMFLNANKIPID